MKTDIEIAQSCKMKDIADVAKSCGIDLKYLERYGNYKAKIDLEYLKNVEKKVNLYLLPQLRQPLPARVKPQPR